MVNLLLTPQFSRVFFQNLGMEGKLKEKRKKKGSFLKNRFTIDVGYIPSGKNYYETKFNFGPNLKYGRVEKKKILQTNEFLVYEHP